MLRGLVVPSNADILGSCDLDACFHYAMIIRYTSDDICVTEWVDVLIGTSAVLRRFVSP